MEKAEASVKSKSSKALPTAASQDRRSQIEEVATRAFCKMGYSGASMRDIAREMKTTQAAVYYHFSSKEDILHSIISRFTEQLLALLRERFESTTDPVESLRRALLAHILLQETHSFETRLVIEEKRNLGQVSRDRIVLREKEVYALYRQRVLALVASGRARAFEPAVVTFALLGIVNYFLHWFRPGGPLSLRLAAEQSISLMLDGLLLPEKGSARANAKRSARVA